MSWPPPDRFSAQPDRSNSRTNSGASRRDFDFLALDRSFSRSRFLFVQHHSVSIPDILFQLFERCALAEDTRYLRQASHEPFPVAPILELKMK
jgi:hypothetical protein